MKLFNQEDTMFPLAYAEILQRVRAIDPVKYASTRNYINGAVTYLSPYISRGIISTKLILSEVLKKGYKPAQIEKFIQELAWRDYWQQVWIAKGNAINQDLKHKLVDLEYFADRFSLNKIDTNSANSKCSKYIISRELDKCDSFSECCYEDSKSEKIFIFNKDNVSNKILGYSVRSIDDNYWGPKYKMMNYSEINREVSKLGMTEEELNEIDSLNNIFNILNIDFKKKITI